MTAAVPQLLVAIACGGTGGHVFPGLAVGRELQQRGCAVLLLISPKQVDQQAVAPAPGLAVATLPAVGLTRGNVLRFAIGFARSFREARSLFRAQAPGAVLAMGGFTSAPPVLAGKARGAATFLHDSNSVPGRANRWLARVVDQAYVGFPQAAARLHSRDVVPTGTPVRPELLQVDRAAARRALGLDPNRPVLLVTGGSQGATAVNRLMAEAAPRIAEQLPELQFVHLTGSHDEAGVRAAYARHHLAACVRAFLPEMAQALAAATVAVSRAGGSSLAELAAVRLPALLIPFPAAADDHQLYNAKAFADTGAALMRTQTELTVSNVTVELLHLLRDESRRAAMQQALQRWESPRAAAAIADRILAWLQAVGRLPAGWTFPAEGAPVNPEGHVSAVLA